MEKYPAFVRVIVSGEVPDSGYLRSGCSKERCEGHHRDCDEKTK